MCLTIPVFGIPVPIPFPLPPLPVGWGAAIAGDNGWAASKGLLPTNNFEHRNGDNTGVDPAAAVAYGAAHFNPMTAIPAWIQVAEGPGTNLDTRAGLQTYFDVKDNVDKNDLTKSMQASTAANNHNRNNRAPAWILEIERNSTSLLTSSTGGTYQIGGGTDGQLNLPMNMKHNKIRALSKAEAYFSRPKELFARSDGKTEWGSLYSPYWQARLQPSSLLEQAASIISPL